MRSVMLTAFTAVFALAAHTQEWSAAEQEVWAAEQACWERYVSEDLEAGLACFHDDYQGWSFQWPVPNDKADARREWTRSFEDTDVIDYVLKPVAISVYGDVAVVHYYYWLTMRTQVDETINSHGRWTDVLLKQNGRWVWIADAGGQTGS